MLCGIRQLSDGKIERRSALPCQKAVPTSARGGHNEKRALHCILSNAIVCKLHTPVFNSCTGKSHCCIVSAFFCKSSIGGRRGVATVRALQVRHRQNPLRTCSVDIQQSAGDHAREQGPNGTCVINTSLPHNLSRFCNIAAGQEFQPLALVGRMRSIRRRCAGVRHRLSTAGTPATDGARRAATGSVASMQNASDIRQSIQPFPEVADNAYSKVELEN